MASQRTGGEMRHPYPHAPGAPRYEAAARACACRGGGWCGGHTLLVLVAGVAFVTGAGMGMAATRSYTGAPLARAAAPPARARESPVPAPPRTAAAGATPTPVRSKAEIVLDAAVQWQYETPFADPAGMAVAGTQILDDEYLAWDEEQELALWRRIEGHAAEKEQSCPCTLDPMFPRIDALVLWGMIRTLKPSRIVEVGSGISTKVAGFAALQNARESGVQGAFAHVCIEPYRTSVLEELKFVGLQVIATPVQHVNVSDVFDKLRAGDVLFLDSSHVIRPYGDVLFELLTVLPRLAPGVIVHIHDIFAPFDYPREWMLRDERVYTEQWLVAALVHASAQWRILWSGHRNFRTRPHWFADAFPRLEGLEHLDTLTSSLWMRKVA